MKCWKCDYQTQVVESRERDGYVYRRRVCQGCGERFRTSEVRLLPQERPIKTPFQERSLINERDDRILARYELGVPVERLAQQENLATGTIYASIRSAKNAASCGPFSIAANQPGASILEKSFHLLIAVAAIAASTLAAAQSNTVTNEGRIMSNTSVFASVNGNGGSLSHAETRAGATANGSIGAPAPGKVTLGGDIAGYSDITAYNTAFGSGVGTAGGRVWSDARVHGDIGTSIPTGSGAIAIDVEGGMRDPGRNGSDVTVLATTKQDGFANGMYNGGATAALTMSSGPGAGGTVVQGNVQSTSYQHAEVVAGGVTFNGGTPDGQSAAVRFGQSGAQVTTDGWFHDPTH